MEDKRTYDPESIIRYFSLIDSTADEMFIKYMLDKNPLESEVIINSNKETQFLNQFSEEKTFAELIVNTTKARNIPASQITEISNISEDRFQTLIKGDTLPNKIPLKRMLKLLDFLKIPIQKAIDSFRVSFKRYNHLQNDLSPGFVSFRRKTMQKSFSVISNQSKETLRKNLETYITRLIKEESVE